jgi:hypothetical protein
MDRQPRRAFNGLVVLITLTLALAVGGEPALDASWAADAIHGSSQAHPLEILRGPLARLASGRLPPAERASLLRGTPMDGPGHQPNVAVTIHFDEAAGPRTIAELTSAGARVVNVGGTDVEAYVPPDRLVAMAELAGVRAITPLWLTAPTSYVSPAVALHGSTAWQSAGIIGSGVKVGIIDGGFSGLVSRLGTELPATVHTHCYTTPGSFTADPAACDNGIIHGTAVAETVFDMAPGIDLYLASAETPLDAQKAALWLTSNGVRIINASITSGNIFDGPGDGTSPYSSSLYRTIDRATADGALWVNAAGNAGETGWSGAWSDVNGNGSLEFAGTDERNTLHLAAGDAVTVAIRWADPWGASANNYDLMLYAGSTLVASSTDVQAGKGDPVEVLQYQAPSDGTYGIRIVRSSGAATARMQLLVSSSEETHLKYEVAADTLPTPADSRDPGMLTVGAVNVSQPATVEPYSSRGPTVDGRTKPDLVAADCAPTTVEPVFCGTSGAAPLVAGAAAQVLEANPDFTPTQLATWLRLHAIALSSPTPDSTSGWGRLDLGPLPFAPAAGLAFASPPTGATAGAPLTGQPAIRIVDASGLTIGAGLQSVAPVSISLATNPTGANLSCPGGLTLPAHAGMASFVDCAIDQPGVGYTIRAQMPGLPPVVSASFDILAAGTALPLTLAASPAAVTSGTAASLTARFGPAPATGGRPLDVQFSADGLTWTTTGTNPTDAGGQMLTSSTAVVTGWYRVSFAGAADLAAATSYPVAVSVRQSIALAASVRPARTIARGTSVIFTSTVRPAGSAVARSSVGYVIYRRVGGSWVVFRRAYVTADGNGRAKLTWRFATSGSWYVRSAARATASNAASGWSAIARYDVR